MTVYDIMPTPAGDFLPAAEDAGPGLPRRVRRYLDALVQSRARDGHPLTSLVLFGSAAKGGFAADVSDVDLIAVLADGATPSERERFGHELTRLEIAHGFRHAPARPRNRLEAFAERAGGNALSGFVCSRSDLLSGDVARVFGLRPAEALLVDRIVFANVVASAATVWGEELLPLVPVPPVRRADVFKALFASTSQALLSIAAYPVMPDATRYAMGALKRALHGCYFCYHLRTAPLDDEIAFFDWRLGESRTRAELLAVRRHYRRSFSFTLRCLPTLVRLHLRTAYDNRFPLAVVGADPARPSSRGAGRSAPPPSD